MEPGLPTAGAEVVMLGDSITARGDWSTWFPDAGIANRGVSGNTTAQVLARMDAAALGPATRKVFVLIGTNDLSRGVDREQIAANTAEIVAGVRARAPRSRIVVQSVMPRRAEYRDAVLELNDRVRTLVRGTVGDDIEFLDLWPALADDDGALTPTFTDDGLHLTAAGYSAWVAVLVPLLSASAFGGDPGKAEGPRDLARGDEGDPYTPRDLIPEPTD